MTRNFVFGVLNPADISVLLLQVSHKNCGQCSMMEQKVDGTFRWNFRKSAFLNF